MNQLAFHKNYLTDPVNNEDLTLAPELEPET